MKSLLTILAAVVLGSTTSVPSIFLNTTLIKSVYNSNNIYLAIERISQERDWDCVAANIQMIFRFYNLEGFSQQEIFEDLDGVEGEGGGIFIDSSVANYLNNHITTDYAFNDIPEDFGTTRREQLTFQEYVYNSLDNDHPVILGHTIPLHDGSNAGHSILITGIEPNFLNPELAWYRIIDPGNFYPEQGYIRGSDLSSIFLNGGELVGQGINPDFENEETLIVIDNHEVGADKLNDYEDHEAAKIITDVTATTGANTTGNFADMVSKISLLNFNSEIYNFTWRKNIKNFIISTNDIPNNNDNWVSSKITISESSEDIGRAHIEGRILAQIKFERTKSLNHLLMYLIIYVGGISWSTGNWAHVWFKTGNILDFIKK